MRSVISVSLIIITIFVFYNCKRTNDIETQRLSWVTEDPLSIPYRIRYQRYERPNLVRNGSFESGRTFTIDSGRTAFVIDGWQHVGDNIEWVDIKNDSIYASDEVYSGSRSVKIIRDKAYETDNQGDRIISDFIRVIPGNYEFSFYTRLQNIMPSRFRLGTRMYDAIDVRLLYYDRNKILLDSKQYFPQPDQHIDISNKTLSFANYLNIPYFEWGKIIGKSYSFPFPDGDIPSNAYYVKVNLGLKGTGTMWVDSVTLCYTRKNFSVNERMSQYTDTSYIMHYNIIPTPKYIRDLESIIYYSSDNRNRALPVIIIPQDEENITLKAAYLLRKAILRGIRTVDDSAVNAGDILITTSLSDERLHESKLVFSLGNTTLYNGNHEDIPVQDIKGEEQGYSIYTNDDLSNVVFLNGNNNTGIYYAALTAIQLFDKKQPVFHNARIIDYPDFEGRHYSISEWNSANVTEDIFLITEELVGYKFNGAILDINHGIGSSSAFRNLQQISSFFGSNDLFRTYGMISPDQIFPTLPDIDSTAIIQNTKFGYQWMQDMAEQVLSAGLHGIIFAPSFRLPEDSSLCYSYPLIPKTDYGIATNQMLELRGFVLSRYPGSDFLYCPPLFNNELVVLSNAFGEQALNIRDIPVLWSGNSFFGMHTDDADAGWYIKHVSGTAPVFFDNSMTITTPWGQYGGANPYYPGKLKLFNIFEPYRNTDIREIFPKLDQSRIFVNQTSRSEIDIIRLATAADFFWNMKQYDPDYSLWKVLVMRYGVDAARELIPYAGNYAEMLEIFVRLNKTEQFARNLKNGQDKLQAMHDQIMNIENILGGEHKLIKELWSDYQAFRMKLDLYQDQSLTP